MRNGKALGSVAAKYLGWLCLCVPVTMLLALNSVIFLDCFNCRKTKPQVKTINKTSHASSPSSTVALGLVICLPFKPSVHYFGFSWCRAPGSMGSPGSRGEGNMWSDSTELGMGHGGDGKSLPVSGMGVKPENSGEHTWERGCFLFPLEQLKLSPPCLQHLLSSPTPCYVLSRTQVPLMVVILGRKPGFFLTCCFRGWKKGAELWWETRKDEERKMVS